MAMQPGNVVTMRVDSPTRIDPEWHLAVAFVAGDGSIKHISIPFENRAALMTFLHETVDMDATIAAIAGTTRVYPGDVLR